MRVILRDCNNQLIGLYSTWKGAKIAATKLENKVISLYDSEEKKVNNTVLYSCIMIDSSFKFIK